MMKNYVTMLQEAGIGRTPQLCQDALIDELKVLFNGKKYSGQEGREELTIYKQDLPIPEDNDEDVDTESSPSPYIVVQMQDGTVSNDNSTQTVTFSLILCCYDNGKKREGYQDVANIKEDIVQHMCAKPYFGGCFTVLKPIAWALQINDTAPYYYGAVTLICTAPAMTQATELEALL